MQGQEETRSFSGLVRGAGFGFSSKVITNCFDSIYSFHKYYMGRAGEHHNDSRNFNAPLMDTARRRVLHVLAELTSEERSWRLVSSDGKLEKPSFKRRFRPRSKKEMSSLQSHLLLLMLNNSLKNDHSFGEGKLGIGQNFQDDVGTADFTKVWEGSTFPLGIFLQPHSIKISKITSELSLEKGGRSFQKHKSTGFARLQGEPQLCVSSYHGMDAHSENYELMQPRQAFSIHFNRAPLMALKDLMPQISLALEHSTFPDREKLNSVQDFFLYTENEGRQIFEQLDRDNDGKITTEDLKVVLAKMKLPLQYADKFMCNTQKHWVVKSFGWSEFLSIMQEKEPVMIRLFNSLSVSESGTIQRKSVVDLLQRVGLAASEANVTAMIKLLGVEPNGFIKYNQFRKFMLFVPIEQLLLDPWSVWFKGAISPSQQNLRYPVNLFFKLVKGEIEVDNLQKVAKLSDFVVSKAKLVSQDPIMRVGAEVLEIGSSLLSNAAAELTDIRHFGFHRERAFKIASKDPIEREKPEMCDFGESDD